MAENEDRFARWTILRRLLLGLPTLAGVVIVSFVLTRLLPGDPAVYFAGAAPTPEAIADLRERCCSTVRCGSSSPPIWASSRTAISAARW